MVRLDEHWARTASDTHLIPTATEGFHNNIHLTKNNLGEWDWVRAQHTGATCVLPLNYPLNGVAIGSRTRTLAFTVQDSTAKL